MLRVTVLIFVLLVHVLRGADPAAAIFIDNRGAETLNPRIPAFQDALAAELASQGFTVIDPNMTVRVLNDYEGLSLPDADQDRIAGKALDALLLKRTSMQQLARNLNAEYIVHASLLSQDVRQQKVTAYGANTVVQVITLRVSFKVAGVARGGIIVGDTLELSEKRQLNAHLQVDDSGLTNRMLGRAAEQIASAMRLQVNQRMADGKLPAPETETYYAPLSVAVTVRGMEIPELQVDESGNYTLATKTFPVEATGVAVEIDGAMVGTTPGTFEVAPGFHSISLTRDDLKPFTRQINVSPRGSNLNLEMALKPEVEAKWRERLEYVQKAKTGARLTDVQIEALRAYAKNLNEGGYRVDTANAKSGSGGVQPPPGSVEMPEGLKQLGFVSGGGLGTGGNVQAAVRAVEKSVGIVVAYAPLKNGNFAPLPCGTAWVFRPDAFATNAHVADAVLEYNKKYGASAYVLMNKNENARYEIRRVQKHEDYGRRLPSPGGEAAFEYHSDVALLFTRNPIDEKTLPIASEAELRDLDAGSEVFFVGFPVERLLGDNVNFDSALATVQIGNVTTVSDWWMGDSGFRRNKLIRHNMGSAGGASGSPILNANGSVVALLNAGNIGTQVVMSPSGEPSVARAPSAAMINFGIRSDMLAEVEVKEDEDE